MSNPLPPLETRPANPIDPIWLVTAGGFVTMIFVGLILAAILHVNSASTTQPTDVPVPKTLVLNYGTSLAATAMLLGSSRVLRPGALTQMGLSPRGVTRGIWQGARAAIVIVPLVFIVSVLTEQFWKAVGHEHQSAHPLLRLFRETTLPQRWAIVLLAAVVAPIGEELLFRGHLQTALLRTSQLSHRRAGVALAIGISSLIFTLFHSELWMMPPLMVLSVAMGSVFHWTRNVMASITIHVCFNSASLMYFWLTMT